MTELFTELPENVKRQAEQFIDLTLSHSDPFDIVNILNEYVSSCKTEEERDFCNFYINMRLEEMKNGSFTPKW